MGRDASPVSGSAATCHFNPLAPRGARPTTRLGLPSLRIFQSTRPAWGETVVIVYIRVFLVISIHSPRVGRDHFDLFNMAANIEFQSTRPAWGETCLSCQLSARVIISIHSPRVGRDLGLLIVKSDNINFNPLAPRGARPRSGSRHSGWTPYFNPLAPRGARRLSMRCSQTAWRFQSTRPAWGETRTGFTPSRSESNFNPLAPRGARLSNQPHFQGASLFFQSTRPAWGETLKSAAFSRRFSISIHSPRVGRDVIPLHTVVMQSLFQSTRPAWGETGPPDCKKR